jgi:molecular chaperone DnaK
MAADNKTIGRFRLDGIPPAPRGVPQIEVTFDIDANGIVNVTAKDTATGKEQKITITATSHLTDDEIEKMVKEAKVHVEEDKKKRDLIEAKNNGDNLIYTTEKLLKDVGDKAPADIKGKMDEQVKTLRKSLESENVDQIKAETDKLRKLQEQLSQVLYAKAGAGGPGGPGAEAGAGEQKAGSSGQQQGGADEEVIDAEFEAKDEDDKKKK